MNKKCDLSGVVLSIVTGIAVFAAMLVRAFFPNIIIPRLNGVTVVLLSVTALVLDCYICRKDRKRSYALLPLYAALIFGVFPWVACFLSPLEALKSGILGAVIFTALAFLFDSMLNRISNGKATKAAPAICGVGIFLAAQCLMGII